MIQKILNLSILDEMGEGQISFQEGVDMTYCPTYYDLTNNGVIIDVSPIDVFQYSIVDGKTSYSNYQLVSEDDVQLIGSSSWIDVTYNVTSTSSPLTLFTVAQTPIALEIDGTKIENPSSAYTFSTTGSHTVRSYYDVSKTNFTSGIIGTPASANMVDVSNLNTQNANTFSNLFKSCSKITQINGLETLKTSKVSALTNTFADCSSLTSLDGIESWNTSNVQNLNYTFSNCSKISSFTAVENWDVSKATNLEKTFALCSKLTNINFVNWNPHPTTMFGFLYQCPSLQSATNFQNFDTSNATNLSSIFNNSTATASTLSVVTGMENWDLHQAKGNLNNVYNGTSTIFKFDKANRMNATINLSGWTLSSATASDVFYCAGTFVNARNAEFIVPNLITEQTKFSNMSAVTQLKNLYAFASDNTNTDGHVLFHGENWKFKTKEVDGNIVVDEDFTNKFPIYGFFNLSCTRQVKKYIDQILLVMNNGALYYHIVDPVAIENVVYPLEVASTVTSVTVSYDGVQYEKEYHMSGDYMSVLTTKNEEKSRTPLTVTFEIGENYTTEPITFTKTITFEDATYTLSFVQSPIGQEELTVFTNMDDEEESIFVEGEMTTGVIPYTEYNLKSCAIGIRVTSLGTALFANSAIESVTIPNSITNIDGGVFYSCQSLTSVTIPNSVTNIGDMVFMNCRSLENIHIGNSVVNIGNSAFLECESLTSVTIPNSVKTIDNEAFKGCTSLTSVTIGNSVTSIGNYAFNHCLTLINITFEGTIEEWNSITKGLHWCLNVLASEVICSNGSCPIDSEIA